MYPVVSGPFLPSGQSELGRPIGPFELQAVPGGDAGRVDLRIVIRDQSIERQATLECEIAANPSREVRRERFRATDRRLVRIAIFEFALKGAVARRRTLAR